MNLQGRVAIITGGSRGIGRATVERLAEEGVHPVLSYLNDEQGAQDAVKMAEHYGVQALAVRSDVRQLKEAERLVQVTLEQWGRLDILVCNAGIWQGNPVDEMDEGLWDRVIDINLKGTWAVCRAAVPQMKRQHGGRIVIVSSTAGQRGEAGFSNYAAAKGGQIAFTKSLATELAPHNINVNAVAPGWVDTEMIAEVVGDERGREKILQTIPLGRMATADDVARPIVFLCGDWARHITGGILNINGGSVLCG